MFRNIANFFFPPQPAPVVVQPPAYVPDSNPRRPEFFKVVFWGKFGVGKSSIVSLLETGNFNGHNRFTIRPDFPYSKLILEDGKEVKLQLWDTAGQERFNQELRIIHFRQTHIFVIVYSPDDAESFRLASQSLEVVTKDTTTDPHCQFLLVCSYRTKPSTNQDPPQASWEISSAQGNELAVRVGAFYLEVNVADVGALSLLQNKLRELIHKKKLSEEAAN